MIVVALVLGGFAAVLAGRYLTSAKATIDADSQPVEVLVAEADIPRGVSAEQLFEQKLVTRARIPRRFVAAGAISSARMVEGQVLAVPVSSGEQLSTSRFQYPSEAGLAHNVPKDYVAVSLPVDMVSGVSGLLKPGDHVAVILSLADDDEGDDSVTRIVVRKTRVLAVDRSVGVEKTEGVTQAAQGGQGLGSGGVAQQETGPITVTLALSPEDAEKLVYGVNFGFGSRDDRKVWLALLPADSDGAPVTAGVRRAGVYK
ncbi:MAG: Flp pilus assembly protein CpaB [Coriobacteriia bacterium]|nr:Flp pilus assembly protein CpaB [Coriobacteriia bacterium]